MKKGSLSAVWRSQYACGRSRAASNAVRSKIRSSGASLDLGRNHLHYGEFRTTTTFQRTVTSNSRSISTLEDTHLVKSDISENENKHENSSTLETNVQRDHIPKTQGSTEEVSEKHTVSPLSNNEHYAYGDLHKIVIGSLDESMWQNIRCLLLTTMENESRQYSIQNKKLNVSLQVFQRLCLEAPSEIEICRLVRDFLKIMFENLDEMPKKSSRHESSMSREFVAEHILSSIIHEIKNRRWRPTSTVDFRNLIRLASMSNNVNQAERWLELMARKSRFADNQIRRPSRYDYTAVIQAWSRVAKYRRPAAALRCRQLVREMQKQYQGNGQKHKNSSMKPTEAAYVGWIMAHTVNGETEQAEHVLKEMWHRSELDQFWPGTTVYNAVLHGWAMQGDAERADALLCQMCEAASTNPFCMPDIKSFTTVIGAWARSNNKNAAERAERLLKMLHDTSVKTGNPKFQPNAQTLTAVLNCWAKSDDERGPERAEAILMRMQEHYVAGNVGLRPNIITFNVCMNAWARSNKPEAPERVERLFQAILRQRQNGDANIRPDEYTYMARINAWERSNRSDATDHAQRILDDMIIDPNVTPSRLHFSRVIRSWAKHGNGEKADDLLKQMMETTVSTASKDDVLLLSAHNFVLAAFSKSFSLHGSQKAEEIMDRMKKSKLNPDITSFNSLMAAWARCGADDAPGKCLAILDQIKESKLTPDVFTYGTILQAVAKSPKDLPSKEQIARDILFDMAEMGVEPNNYISRLVSDCSV